VGAPLVVWAACGAPFVPDYPALKGFNFQGGGSVSPEYGALLAGLVFYTAANIAEIVRAPEDYDRARKNAGKSRRPTSGRLPTFDDEPESDDPFTNDTLY